MNFDRRAPPFFGGGREWFAIFVLIIPFVLGTGSFVYLSGATGLRLPGQAAAATKPTAAVQVPTPAPGGTVNLEKRVFTQAEITSRLRQEITNRIVQFQNADVRLVDPDRVIVVGRIPGPTGGLVGVEVETQLTITDRGLPKLTPTKLSASGVEIPSWASEALRVRIEEANRELAAAIPGGQRLQKVVIQNGAITADLVSAAR